MKIKTSELKGAALDWAVAKCEGDLSTYDIGEQAEKFRRLYAGSVFLHYSTDWAQGGPIIEQEKISINYVPYDHVTYGKARPWQAEIRTAFGSFVQWSHAPIIAAMRCYVASKIGNDVDVPDEVQS